MPIEKVSSTAKFRLYSGSIKKEEYVLMILVSFFGFVTSVKKEEL